MRHTRSNPRNILLTTLAMIGLSATAATPLSAATVAWVLWSSITPGTPVGGSAGGTIAQLPTPVTVGYTGEVLSSSYTGFGPAPAGLHPDWAQGNTYAGGTVNNSPSNTGSIALSGGPSTRTDTLTFSPPVINPVMTIWSLGSANIPSTAEFDFTAAEPFTVQSGGIDDVTGAGTSVTIGSPATTLTGTEGNGVIQFTGTYSTLTWTNPVFENDYAFTVGADGSVPEPTSLSLLTIASLTTLKRRRSR